ncbi:MAG: rhodanese-like domain-containing protein [Acidobacteria bacterium]|nr:rhodanese-like domain-containing protein [Acidobacteriota bacterium]
MGGTLITIGTPVAIVADSEEQVKEAFMRLARVGIESVKGFTLIGDYKGELNRVGQVSVEQAKEATAADGVQFIDVRRVQEHAAGHAPGTINLPLDRSSRDLDNLDPAKPTYVICQSGYRSSLGTSVLENAGFNEIYNVLGGTKAWIDGGFDTEVSATACASSK